MALFVSSMAGEEIMKRLFFLILVGLLTVDLGVSAQTTGPPQTAPAAPAPKSAPRPVISDAERGERAFKANCSRCHYAPDTLNPRITGTVIRHMRVRANLSAADERDILHFFNP